MNSPYLMRKINSCGPDAIKFASGKTYEEVDKAWGIDSIDKFYDIADTPWNHFGCLEKLNIPFEICNCSRIIQNKAVNEKTVILIHFIKTKEVTNWLQGLENKAYGLLNQHWVVLHSVTPTHVNVYFGDGFVRSFTKELFQRMYSGGRYVGPQCAYIIGQGSYHLSWYQKLYAKLTGIFT